MRLQTAEFIRRFLMHVLPSGFHRIRHYGFLSNKARAQALALARQHLYVAPEPQAPVKAETESPVFVCTHCGELMIIIGMMERTALARAPPVPGIVR